MRALISRIKFQGDISFFAFFLYLAGNSKGGDQLKIFQELSALLPGIYFDSYLFSKTY